MITTLIATFLNVGKSFEYKIGPKTFEGYRAVVKKSPLTVIIVHDWNGIDEHEIGIVEKLARLGYSAAAIDVYGKGVRPRTVETCSAESGKYYRDPKLFMERLTGGINALNVKGKKVAAGYCFGGGAVLELARRNLGGLSGVASFHGGMAAMAPRATKINSHVAVFHGAADPFEDKAMAEATKVEMKNAKSFSFTEYPGVVHAFTVKSMGFTVDGAKYDAHADSDSWSRFVGLLKTWSK